MSSFSIQPAFSFNLNRILVGNVKFGKYDGIHVCLTAVTSTDKVILHNPYKKLNTSNNRLSWSETSADIATLNFNQEIRAIETGRLSEHDSKEVLVIGSPTQLLGKRKIISNTSKCFFRSLVLAFLYLNNSDEKLITLTAIKTFSLRKSWKAFKLF